MCQDGVCVDTEENQCSPTCAAGETCENGMCVNIETGCSPTCNAGETCENGTCVTNGGGTPRLAAIGEVIISELMVRPTLDQPHAEWIELMNLTEDVLIIDGCALSDLQSTSPIPLAQLSPLSSGEAFLIVSSDDPSRNGLLSFDATHSIDLRNEGELITLTCNDIVFDSVDYPDEITRAVSFQKSADSLSVPNDSLTHWCEASLTEGYDASPEALQYYDNPPHVGTPGAANRVCATP